MAYLLQFIREVAERTIEEINKAYGISSPSKVFTKIGEYMVAGLQRGLEGMNDLLGGGAVSGALGGTAALAATGGRGGGDVTVYMEGPLVGQMIVPNMAVGRGMAKELSKEFGQMAMAQRTPA